MDAMAGESVLLVSNAVWFACQRVECTLCTYRTEQWSQEFADGVRFTKDPVVCTPDVTEIQLKEDDEFVIIASDGLW